MASVVWAATGQVDHVSVQVGDFVTQGDTLMTLAAGSTSARYQAEAELLSAQIALDVLLNPTATALANAEQAVVAAEDSLKTAQRNLRWAEQPNVSYYEDQLAIAQRGYDTAAANLEMTHVGSGSSLNALQSAQTSADDALSNWHQHITWYGEFHDLTHDAHTAYDQAVEDARVAQLRYDTSLASSQSGLDTARDTLDQALANLAAARAGPATADIPAQQAAVEVAEANLAQAQQTQAELLNGADPNEIRKAELRVQAAEASLETQSLRAPITGEVLEINYQPGDTVSPTEVAVLLADRSRLHVGTEIDESDISQVRHDQAVELTFDAVPGLTLPGRVAYINPLGEAVQGLVKYTVRIDTTGSDPRVLLGMTASARIVTDVAEGALVVPLDAVQLDDQGEYVLRLAGPGAFERVRVVSGAVLEASTAQTAEDVVLVTGDLRPGDEVQLVVAVPTDNGGLFEAD
jgi:RND family efflux transporter MFP subunit